MHLIITLILTLALALALLAPSTSALPAPQRTIHSYHECLYLINSAQEMRCHSRYGLSGQQPLRRQ